VKDILHREEPAARLPRAEVARQTEAVNGRIYELVSEWLKQEIAPGIIEQALLYHWLRTSTVNANVPEEFFQKIG
jgi:hypothetical protein